jgi:A/G-specific adenine glycosylase
LLTSPTAINALAKNEGAHLAHDLLQWYDAHGRTLPWRSNTPNPYHVWVSEIMLQQTTVRAVIPYFNRWIHRWPTLKDLACADIEDVLQLWQGLGYYTRAHNLHKCAQQLMQYHAGQLPKTYDSLLKLPGVGPYTAGAIAAIAFEQPTTTIDGNIARVFARVLEKSGDKDALLSSLPADMEVFRPKARIGDYTQALMDLGSLICKPKMPLCSECPVHSHCKSYNAQTVHLFPNPKIKPQKPKRYGHFFCVLKSMQNGHGYHILLQQEPNRLLKGLWRPLTSNWDFDDQTPSFPVSKLFHKAERVTHVFTHFALHLHIWYTIVPDDPQLSGQWDDLTHPTLPLSNLTRKALGTVRKALLREQPLRLAS